MWLSPWEKINDYRNKQVSIHFGADFFGITAVTLPHHYHLNNRWADWFEGLSIMLTDDGDTILSGVIVDQAALHDVFRKIRNLGLTIISVNSQAKGE